jgi:peptidoglycan/xylan/chitin deacetylase (PgdA/CDA1 family)
MNYLYEKNYNVIPLSDLVCLLEEGKRIPSKTVSITFDDGYEDNYRYVFPVLKKYNFFATIFLTTDWVGDKQHASKNGIKIPMLDWSQVAEMHTSGLVSFEPHTVSHPKLSMLTSDEVVREITQSKDEVEQQLGKTCKVFAYPYGNFDFRTEEVVRRLFSASLTVNRGFVGGKDSLWRLRRNAVDSFTNMTTFKLKV